MIHMPRRSVTRFFIPLIDVMILLFCIFLLLPVFKENHPENPDAGLKQKLKESEGEVRKLRALLESRGVDLRPFNERYAIRVLEIDPKNGQLVYYSGTPPSRRVIGNVTAADMKNFTSKPNPPPAVLVTVAGLNVTGRAHAGMGNTTPNSVDFSYAEIQSQTVKTVTTTDFTSSLTSSLLGDLSLSVNGVGLPIPGLTSTVSGLLSNSTASVDQLLASVLATLGVGIGQADVRVSGVRCDSAVLVN